MAPARWAVRSAVVLAGLMLACVPHRPAAAASHVAAPMLGAASAEGWLEQVYYYRGRYYPYQYRGSYYPYRYRDQYFHNRYYRRGRWHYY